MPNIFITGATGFIGNDLLKIIDFHQHSVFALSRTCQESSMTNLKYLQGDIFNLHTFSDVLAATDFFIHVAGEKRDEKKMREVNVDGMKYILSVLSKYPNIRLLYISSSGVYGIENHPYTILHENADCYPDSAYEKSKLEAEVLLQEFAITKKSFYTILRPSNVFGEFDKGMKLLNLFVTLQKKRFLYVNKTAMVNYLYVRQLSETIKIIINREIFNNEIYNVNSPCTIEQFIEQCKSHLKLQYRTKKIPEAFAGLLKIFARFSDLLPSKYQFLNSGKYRELTSIKYYSTNKINKIITVDEAGYLQKGILNLIEYYKSINKLQVH